MLSMRLRSVSPQQRLNENRMRLADLERRITDASCRITERRWERLSLLSQRLEGLSPLQQMRRGYAFVTDTNGKTITSVSQLNTDQQLRLYLTDGCSRVRVEEIFTDGENYGGTGCTGHGAGKEA